MAIVQTRRTVSLSAAMITAAKLAAESAGVSLSRYVYEAVATRMKAEGIEAPPYNPPGYAAYGKSTQEIERGRSPIKAAMRTLKESWGLR